MERTRQSLETVSFIEHSIYIRDTLAELRRRTGTADGKQGSRSENEAHCPPQRKKRRSLRSGTKASLSLNHQSSLRSELAGCLSAHSSTRSAHQACSHRSVAARNRWKRSSTSRFTATHSRPVGNGSGSRSGCRRLVHAAKSPLTSKNRKSREVWYGGSLHRGYYRNTAKHRRRHQHNNKQFERCKHKRQKDA